MALDTMHKNILDDMDAWGVFLYTELTNASVIPKQIELVQEIARPRIQFVINRYE